MLALYALMSVLTSNAGTDAGGTTEQGGSPGTDEGFTRALELPEIAYPIIAASLLLGLLLVTFAFRSVGKRH